MRVVVDKPMRMGGGLGENTQEYAQEYHRLTKMTAYAPRETESPVQLFLIANTERIVQTDTNTFELRGMYDAYITKISSHFPKVALAFVHFLFGDYPMPPIEQLKN